MSYLPPYPEGRHDHAIAVHQTHRPGPRRLLRRRRCRACHHRWPCAAAEWAAGELHCRWFRG